MMPKAGSNEERAAFDRLQTKLSETLERVNADYRSPHTLVVVPSLSVDSEELSQVTGVIHYEERMLSELMRLRRPRCRIIYLTSNDLDPDIIDYYLHLLTGVPSSHARARLSVFSCADDSSRPLTEKLLERPRLIQRIRAAINDPTNAWMVCYLSTARERTLAVQLGIPLNGNDPEFAHLGTKSSSRKILREAGVPVPRGFEDLRDRADIVRALGALKAEDPDLRRAVIKLNEGFSGVGNGVFSFQSCDASSEGSISQWVDGRLTSTHFESRRTLDDYLEKFHQMSGVVEAFVEGEAFCSPSAQTRVNLDGSPQALSTHDQVLRGPDAQVYQGCTFPAQDAYRREIEQAGLAVARVLAGKGARGHFATDFVSVRREGRWSSYALEINLRRGGTTHPFEILRYLTDGVYQTETSLFVSASGRPKYYYATDNIHSEKYRGLLPHDLIDICVMHELHFHSSLERGVVFHLIGALSEHGKLGVVCIGDSHEQCENLYRQTIQTLDRETSRS